jgi:hypothetical protein
MTVCERPGCSNIATEIVGMDSFCAHDAMAVRVARREALYTGKKQFVIPAIKLIQYDLITNAEGEPQWLVHPPTGRKWRISGES